MKKHKPLTILISEASRSHYFNSRNVVNIWQNLDIESLPPSFASRHYDKPKTFYERWGVLTYEEWKARYEKTE